VAQERGSRSRRGGGRTGPPGSGPLVLLLAAVLAAGVAAPAARVARAQGALSAIEADVDQIVRRSRPSMLTIIAQRNVAAEKPAPGAAPQRRVHSRVGSGVAVATDEILTTASVVLGAEHVLVLTPNGLQAEAVLAGLDPIRNIALLRVSGLQLPPVKLATRQANLGDWVIVLGSSYRGAPTQSVGNVALRFREPRMSLLQLTNEVYPGNSGGAALNSRGELLGLVQGELGAPEAPGRREAGERRPGGMSLVIPAEDIQPSYDALRRGGRVRLGYLGVSTRAAFVDSDTEPGLRIPIGALVEAVQPGGPADKAGLRKGDLIVAFEDQRVEYPEQLARWVAAAKPGTSSRLVWAHDEMQRVGTVVLTESPTDIPSWMQVQVGEPVATAPAGTRRITDLQDQIKRLSVELDRLKHGQDSTR
jgi:serine protease Do